MFPQGERMKIANKENLAKKINLNFDSKNYKIFCDKLIGFGHKLEAKSNPHNLKYSVVMNSVRTPYEDVRGWTSRTYDMKSVVFMDMDNTLKWILYMQLEVLINQFNLSKFYIFCTDLKKDSNGEEYGNFLVFCPDKVNFNKVIEIQDRTTCDQSYKRLPMLYRFKTWAWRWSKKFSKDKPKYFGCIENPNKPYNQEVSKAHLLLMKQLYPEIKDDFKDFKNMDNSEKLWIVNYKTSSK